MAEKTTGPGGATATEEGVVEEVDPELAAEMLGIEAFVFSPSDGPVWVDRIYREAGDFSSEHPYHLNFDIDWQVASDSMIEEYDGSSNVGMLRWNLYNDPVYENSIVSYSLLTDVSEPTFTAHSELGEDYIFTSEADHHTVVEYDTAEASGLKDRFGWSENNTTLSGTLEATIDYYTQLAIAYIEPQEFDQIVNLRALKNIRFTAISGSEDAAFHSKAGADRIIGF